MARKTGAGSLGVDWVFPGTKRRFATTTTASSDLIHELAAHGLSWNQVAETILFDDEARAVAQQFVGRGFGAVAAATHVS